MDFYGGAWEIGPPTVTRVRELDVMMTGQILQNKVLYPSATVRLLFAASHHRLGFRHQFVHLFSHRVAKNYGRALRSFPSGEHLTYRTFELVKSVSSLRVRIRAKNDDISAWYVFALPIGWGDALVQPPSSTWIGAEANSLRLKPTFRASRTGLVPDHLESEHRVRCKQERPDTTFLWQVLFGLEKGPVMGFLPELSSQPRDRPGPRHLASNDRLVHNEYAIGESGGQ